MFKEMKKTRILLALWGFADETAKKGELTKRLVRKGESAKDYQPVLGALLEDHAVALQDGQYRLTDAGIECLKQELMKSDFKFTGNVGEKTVNALLKWIRLQGEFSVQTNGEPASAIDSYNEFKQIALNAYERLDRGDNLVPIHRLREEIGQRVARKNFDEWLMEMQAEQLFYLQRGQAQGATREQMEGSIEDKIRGLLFFVSYPS